MPRVISRKARVATAPRRSTRDRVSPDRLKPAIKLPIISKKGRGPGRPRKIDAELEDLKKPTSTRRGPGRPKSVDAIPVQVPSNGTKRRGRPPKAAKLATLIISKASTVAKTARKNATPSKVIKKRGRPAKKASHVKQLPAIIPEIKAEDFTMSSITGHYEIECHAIRSNWVDGFNQTLTVDIFEPDDEDRVSAAFDIGFVHGTLRIAATKEQLEQWCVGGGVDAEEALATPVASPGVRVKRTRVDGEGGNIKKTRAKRVKLEKSPNANRVFFRWRGQNPHDGLRYVDDDDQVGWLDFPRADGLAFWGVIDLPNIAGPGISIHGIRVAKKPTEKPPDWDAFENPIPDSQDGENPPGTNPAPTAVMLKPQQEIAEIEDGEEDISSSHDGSTV